MVDPRGRLIDGHHRLAALVKAGVTLRLRFMLGVETQHLANFDGGEQRTLGDRFTTCQNKAVRDLVQGQPYRAKTTASVVSFTYNTLTGSKKPGLESAVRVVRHYNESIDYAVTNCDRDRLTRRAAVMTAVMLAHHYVTQTSGIRALNHFVDGLVSGEMIEQGDPAYALRRYLIAIATSKNRGKDNRTAKTDSQWVIFVKTLRTIQHALEGSLLQKVALPTNTVAAIEHFTGPRRELAKELKLDALVPDETATEE